MFSSACALAISLTIRTTPVRTTPPDRPVAHVFQNLAHDLRTLPSTSTALAVAVGGFSALTVHNADQDLATWATKRGDSTYGDLGAVLGNGWTQGSAALATYAIGALSHHDRMAHLGSDLIRAQALNGVLTWGLKAPFDRTRPNGGSRSFPSGHTSAAFASAAVVESNFGWRAGAAAYAAAGFIGWTRVRDDQHWLSDVVAGAAIGTIAGRTVTIHHRAWRITPSVGVRQAAVYVIRAR